MFGRRYFSMRWHHPLRYAAIKCLQIHILDAMRRARASCSNSFKNSKISVITYGKRICKQMGIKLQRGDNFTIDDTGTVWLHRPSKMQKSFNNDYWTSRQTSHAAVKSNGGLRGSRATRWK